MPSVAQTNLSHFVFWKLYIVKRR